MRHYELVTILSPMLNQEQTTEAWGQIKNFIASRSGEITQEQSWGTRRLAYPIHRGTYHFLEGAYHLTRFSTERPFNRELETFLRQDERVLRSLVIATEQAGPYPTPMSPPAQAARPAPATPPQSSDQTSEDSPGAEAATLAGVEPVAESETVAAVGEAVEVAAEPAPADQEAAVTETQAEATTDAAPEAKESESQA